MDIRTPEAAIALLSYAVLAAACSRPVRFHRIAACCKPSVIFGATPAYAPAITIAPVPVLRSWPHRLTCRRRPCSARSPTLRRPRVFPRQGWAGADACTRGQQWQPLAGRCKNSLVIVPGLRLLEHQVPGLMAQSPGGPVRGHAQPQRSIVWALPTCPVPAWQVVSAMAQGGRSNRGRPLNWLRAEKSTSAPQMAKSAEQVAEQSPATHQREWQMANRKCLAKSLKNS